MYHQIKKYLAVGVISLNLSLCADLPQPYNSIQTLPYTPYFVIDDYTIFDLIMSNQSSVIVDVDSQDGGVARFIAQQWENFPIQNIYSISDWKSADKSQKHLYQRFLSNVIQENTAWLITPIRMTSLEAAYATNISADFISLVGGNESNTIHSEILAWFPHLNNHGILCGNNWYDQSVRVGVTKAAATLEQNLEVWGNVWFFQKNPQNF